MRSLFAALIHNSISVAVRGTGSVTDSEVIQALYLLPRCWRDYTSLAAARVYENTRHLMSYLLDTAALICHYRLKSNSNIPSTGVVYGV